MNRLSRDGTAEPVSRNQNLRREREQRIHNFPPLADHELDWQPCPVFFRKFHSPLCSVYVERPLGKDDDDDLHYHHFFLRKIITHLGLCGQ